jgi:hypothetical protein
MMGNLFYRNVQPSEIKNMTFHEIVYWNGWHEVLEEQEARAAREAEYKAKGK